MTDKMHDDLDAKNQHKQTNKLQNGLHLFGVNQFKRILTVYTVHGWVVI